MANENNGVQATISTPNREWKYKIEQTVMGARVTVHSMSINEAVHDYGTLRKALEAEGYPVAPENGISVKEATKK